MKNLYPICHSTPSFLLKYGVAFLDVSTHKYGIRFTIGPMCIFGCSGHLSFLQYCACFYTFYGQVYITNTFTSTYRKIDIHQYLFHPLFMSLNCSCNAGLPNGVLSASTWDLLKNAELRTNNEGIDNRYI